MTTKTIRKRNLIPIERVESWTDEEVLTNLNTILMRATISTDFVTEEVEDTGQTIITHEVLVAMSGDKAVFSSPRVLDWPLQLMPMPKAFEGKVH